MFLEQGQQPQKHIEQQGTQEAPYAAKQERTADRRHQQPEERGFNKKLDGPNRPST